MIAFATVSDMKSSQKRTKRIAVCAMSAALCTTILYLGSFIEVLDMSMAVLASLLTMIMVVEYGKGDDGHYVPHSFRSVHPQGHHHT